MIKKMIILKKLKKAELLEVAGPYLNTIKPPSPSKHVTAHRRKKVKKRVKQIIHKGTNLATKIHTKFTTKNP